MTWAIEPPPEVVARNGKDAQAVSRIRTTLKSEKASKEQRLVALDAITYYGAASVPVLLDIIQTEKGNRDWDMPLASAISHVVDKRLVPVLVDLAKKNTNPAVQAEALRGLGVLVGNSWIKFETREKNRCAGTFAISPLAGDAVRSYGEPVLPADRAVLPGLAVQLIESTDTPESVKIAARSLLNRLHDQEDRERKARIGLEELVKSARSELSDK